MTEQEQQEDQAPFDEEPPVDPEKPQVGNSRAKFFMPTDDEAEQQDVEEGPGEESGPSRG